MCHFAEVERKFIILSDNKCTQVVSERGRRQAHDDKSLLLRDIEADSELCVRVVCLRVSSECGHKIIIINKQKDAYHHQ